MKLFVSHSFSDTSGRNEVHVSLLGNLRHVPYKGGVACARKRVFGFRINLGPMLLAVKKIKQCVKRKKALIDGATGIDFCHVQKELLKRRAGHQPRRFDPYGPGNNTTILSDD